MQTSVRMITTGIMLALLAGIAIKLKIFGGTPYLTMATSQRDHMLDREDQRGSVFSWGWRPAMSWMLLFLWSWNGVILPVANATAGTSIVPIPWEHLLGFAGLWLAIYGGGHTIKSVLVR